MYLWARTPHYSVFFLSILHHCAFRLLWGSTLFNQSLPQCYSANQICLSHYSCICQSTILSSSNLFTGPLKITHRILSSPSFWHAHWVLFSINFGHSMHILLGTHLWQLFPHFADSLDWFQHSRSPHHMESNQCQLSSFRPTTLKVSFPLSSVSVTMVIWWLTSQYYWWFRIWRVIDGR